MKIKNFNSNEQNEVLLQILIVISAFHRKKWHCYRLVATKSIQAIFIEPIIEQLKQAQF